MAVRRGLSPWLIFYASAILLLAMAIVGAIGWRAWTRAQAQKYEPAVVRALRDYCEAQTLYHRNDWDQDGTLEYADTFSGLCTDMAGAIGPLRLIPMQFASASRKQGEPYHGYLFDEVGTIAGSPVDWSKTYALCATPASYGSTGIRTFVASNGQIWAKDLGESRFVGELSASPAAEGWVKVRVHSEVEREE